MTRPVCAKNGCGAPAKCRGYCDRHYRYRLHTGRYGYRDAGPAREHVQQLRVLGWPYERIAEAAGTSTWVPHKLDTGGVRKLWAESERAILAVPLVPCPSHRGVDGTGTYRRWEALQWMGWPAAEIAARVGVKPHTIVTLRSRGEPVSFRLAQAMTTVYDELSHLPGPSKQTATKARQRGCPPPAAWDDDTIDDPTPTARERVQIARRMASTGATVTAIARKLRADRRTVRKMLEAA